VCARARKKYCPGGTKEYLTKIGVRVDDLKSASLSEIAVTGTPTVLLVDSKGIVRNVWVGKLSQARQSEVFSAIGIKPQLLTQVPVRN
jgi:hypothetical protein